MLLPVASFQVTSHTASIRLWSMQQHAVKTVQHTHVVVLIMQAGLRDELVCSASGASILKLVLVSCGWHRPRVLTMSWGLVIHRA